MSDQRLFDLVRYQRHELFTANLITQEEFASLLIEGEGSVKRLESYDEVRAQLAAERRRFDWLVAEFYRSMTVAVPEKTPTEWRAAIDAILEGGMSELTVGDAVVWKTCAPGIASAKMPIQHSGTIVVVIPAGIAPDDVQCQGLLRIAIRHSFPGKSPRNHESYIVHEMGEVMARLYWPRVKDLRKVEV